jgi:hypothetical protein
VFYCNIEDSAGCRGREWDLFSDDITNDVSHCMTTTHFLNSNLDFFFVIRVIDEDYKSSNFCYAYPDLPVSSMVTMYSSPTFIGFLGAFDPPKRSLLFSYLS